MANELTNASGPEPEWLPQFVENQRNELAIRAQELELNKQRDNNHLEWAKESLAAQERDRKDERSCNRQKQQDRMRCMLWGGAMLGVLLLAALYLDKDAIAMELVKSVSLLGAGAIGGYGYANARIRAQQQDVADGQMADQPD